MNGPVAARKEAALYHPLGVRAKLGPLRMARSIRDHEFAARCGEIPIGDVDGDSLFALGPKPISQINLTVARTFRMTFIARLLKEGIPTAAFSSGGAHPALVFGGNPQKF
jgi:hypothetical protein